MTNQNPDSDIHFQDENIVNYFCLEQHISKNLDINNNYIVGFSGGLDSVALLYSCIRVGLNVTAIHVQHGNSDFQKNSVDFCENFCNTHKIPFFHEKIPEITQGNWENEARKRRYDIFYEFSKKFVGKDAILLTAHHLDDQIETFFMKMLRGGGISSLACMQPVGTNPIHPTQVLYRPLLSFSKQELQNYALANGLSWMNDPTNTDISYDRNYIRSCVLPIIEQRWENYRENFGKAINNILSASRVIKELLPPASEPLSVEIAKKMSKDQLIHWIIFAFSNYGSRKTPSRKQIDEFLRQFYEYISIANSNSKIRMTVNNVSLVVKNNCLVCEVL